MKKTLLWLAAMALLASISLPTNLFADGDPASGSGTWLVEHSNK